MNTTDPEQPDETPAEALARAAEDAKRLLDAPPSTEIVPVGHGADVTKRQLAARHSDLLRAQIDLEKAAAQMRADIDRQVNKMRAEMQVKLEALKPLQEQIAQLKEGIWTVNLYLGRDETIVPLRGGEPAPAATPISIRQKVLSMDEEAALYAAEGGIDFEDIEEFDQWLLADPANLQQVLPEQRGVVVLVPRRQGADYGNPFANDARNVRNRKSYWLIRNGERLFRMHTDVELETGGPTYNVGSTLMPTRDEFINLFWHTQYDLATGERTRVPMEPGSREWLDAEKNKNARERHYMRSALILQGLIDRTSVFDPKPAEHVSTLSLESYDAGHVVLITDAEESKQLTTGREPFYAWLKRLNGKLRPGMRIVGAFDGTAWRRTGGGSEYATAEGHSRLWPMTAKPPQSLVMHTLQKRKGDGFSFAYDRNEKIYDPNMWIPNPEKPGWGWRGGKRETTAKASCTVKPGDTFIIPFDLVTVDEMRTYLEARDDRHAYLDMFPLLQATIKLKELEAEAEAPMRELLVGELVKAGADFDDAREQVPSLVDHWKLANRWHRPLVTGDREVEAKAVQGILTEYERRRRAIADAKLDEAFTKRFRAAHNPVLIAQKRDGSWVVLEPQQHSYGASVIPGKTFVTEITYTRKARTEPKTREWVLPGVRANRWRIVWQHEDWETWNINATPSLVLSGPEIEQMADDAVEHALHHAATMGRHGKHWRAEYTPMPSRMLAVTYDRKGEYAGRPPRMVTYLLPNEPDDDSRPLLDLDTTWTRSTGGKLVLNHDHGLGSTDLEYHERDARGFNKRPRPTLDGLLERSDLVRYDADVLAALDEFHAAARVRREEKSARSGRAWQAVRSVMREWTRRREAAEFARFMEDYQDESLWPEHLKRITIKFPHNDDSIKGMLRALLDRGIAVDGRTVAELAADYNALEDAGRWKYDVPDDIADIVVVDRPQDEEQG